jgi:hypothetical protein
MIKRSLTTSPTIHRQVCRRHALRGLSTFIALLPCFLVGGATVASAEARPVHEAAMEREATIPRGPDNEPSTRIHIWTSSRSLVGRASAAIVLPPDTSPAAARRYWVRDTSSVTCQSGYVCALVSWNDGWMVFKFYSYGTYRLSWWYDYGLLRNAQTGGAAVRLLGSSGGQVACLGPSASWWSINWTPVWYIRLTSSGC